MVRVFGDGGSEDVEQLEVHQLASTVQSFTTREHHKGEASKKESLVFYMEKWEVKPSARQRLSLITL